MSDNNHSNETDSWSVPYSAAEVMERMRIKSGESIPDDTPAYYCVCRICAFDGISYKYSIQVPLKGCTIAVTFDTGDYDVFRLSTVRKPLEDAVNPVIEVAKVNDLGVMQRYIDKVKDYDGHSIDRETRRRIYAEHGGR